LIVGLLAACACCACALEPATPLANYARQAWLMENGLPQNTVQALAQTRDGFVWLGTEAGLVRFDGSGFAVFDTNSKPALPGNDVRCLLAGTDGSLWVGTSDGLARMKDGAVTAFTTGDGLPANGIRAIAEDGDGLLWAWTNAGLARLDGDQFSRVAGGNGLPAGTVTALIDRPDGDIWVASTAGLGHGRGGRWAGETFQALPPREEIELAAPLPGGELAVAGKLDLALIRGGNVVKRMTAGRELPGNRIQALFADREGSLWIGTNRGLARLEGDKLRTLPVTDPLASASILALMEDREGDLWAGTETDGLHILRDQRFRTYGTREGLTSEAVTTVVEDNTGRLWVGTDGGALSVLRRNEDMPGLATAYSVRDVLLSDVILSLAAAPNGELWVGTPDGLNRIRGSAVDAYTSADGLPDDFIRSLMVDADGSLWIGTRHGLAHWTFRAGQARARASAQKTTYTQASGLGSDLVGAMARDTSGDLWVATFAGLSRIANGKIANYTTADGLSSDVITALLPRSDGTLLIGTQDHGWDLWNGQKFSRVTDPGLEQTTVHAILDDGLGHLWFATGSGIARCDSNESAGRAADANCSHWIEFGTADGLRSRETATNSHPSAWRAHDGTLWFATPKGLVEVDPAHFPVNSVPPPVAIERFIVDDSAEAVNAVASSLRIPAGHVHFQFDYAGLSFVVPQKVRYRYMLTGFDRGWTDAGARRTAYYTNIPPGRYTFRVQAANNDGVWNTAGADLNFELAPHFYQTLWFYALVLVAAAGLVVLLLRLRLLRAEREFRAVLGERNRIAREVHDTLAQGYVGISMQLELLAELLRMKKVDAAERQLDVTRGYVREGLADARQSIWALRSQDSGEKTLPVRLRRIVEAAGNNGFDAKFSLFGAYRPLPAEMEREFLRVAQEAIHNVNKHAGAKNLVVQLEYGPGEVALELRDDGRGFEAGAEPGSAHGHYGLTGMRERAAAIGGTLELTSEPGAGTTVRLQAPAPREKKETM
jgi:ligand-binding sensor domain-containing protein/signal transduction histidine kinase